jgi:hypothetical protein
VRGVSCTGCYSAILFAKDVYNGGILGARTIGNLGGAAAE